MKTNTRTPAWWRGLATAAALCTILAAGCSSDDTKGTPAPEPTQATESAESEQIALPEACDRVATALPAQAPKEPALEALADELVTLSQDGDAETVDAVAQLVPAVDTALSAYDDPTVILPQLDAEEALDRAVPRFAQTCSAAGSAAFG